ncbi:MAG: hemerythrin domain-containing protein [Thermodesulfobacteriota bacterium]
MSERLLKIRYKCLHPSCQVFCKGGEFSLDESTFNELAAAFDDKSVFKSPRNACRLGYSQPFKIVSVEEDRTSIEEMDMAGDASCALDESTDLIEILKAEHRGVLKKLDLIEEQLKKRDVDGLWITTAAIENDILFHSILKEEQALFPAVEAKIPMGPSLIAIMHEDHKEFLSLLHALRSGLRDGDILDGIARSIIMNLKNHILKEDEEFFGMVNDHMDEEEKKALLEKMNALEKTHVPIEPGDRTKEGPSSYSEERKKMNAEIDAMRHNLANQDGGQCQH